MMQTNKTKQKIAYVLYNGKFISNECVVFIWVTAPKNAIFTVFNHTKIASESMKKSKPMDK